MIYKKNMKKILKLIVKSFLGENRFRRLQRDLTHSKGKSTDELYIISKYFRNNNEIGTMIDVGVHYGESSELFLTSNWKVFGFEPDDNNRSKIPDYVINHKNITLFDCALSEQEGEMSFYSSPESSGISSLLNFHESHKELKKVKVEVLNNMIAKNDISNVKMIKIDTEGYDLFVIKGIDFST
jgi:FkbM family methyltransferase